MVEHDHAVALVALRNALPGGEHAQNDRRLGYPHLAVARLSGLLPEFGVGHNDRFSHDVIAELVPGHLESGTPDGVVAGGKWTVERG